jgi:hypothetical protein
MHNIETAVGYNSIENRAYIGLKSNQDKQTMLPQARPTNAKPSEVIVSLRVKLELLPLFQCIYTRLPYLKRRKRDWVRILHTQTKRILLQAKDDSFTCEQLNTTPYLAAWGKRETGDLTLAGPDARAGPDDDEASSFCSKRKSAEWWSKEHAGGKENRSNICRNLGLLGFGLLPLDGATHPQGFALVRGEQRGGVGHARAAPAWGGAGGIGGERWTEYWGTRNCLPAVAAPGLTTTPRVSFRLVGRAERPSWAKCLLYNSPYSKEIAAHKRRLAASCHLQCSLETKLNKGKLVKLFF